MSVSAILLVLCSTLMHVGWNVLARYEGEEAVFFRKMLRNIVAVGFFPVVLSEVWIHSIPAKAWLYVVCSGVCCGVYLFGLARAYYLSDFTIVYPVARALPVLLVAFGDVLCGRNLSWFGWFGIVTVAMGCFLTPLGSFGDLTLARYWNKANLWILVAALGTVGYTLIDKGAAELLKRGPVSAARYGYVFFGVAWLTGICLSRVAPLKSDRKGSSRSSMHRSLLATLLIFGAYWLILWTYQLTGHASYVLAFRQFGIIVGVVTGFLILKERLSFIRVLGALMITAGLVSIGMWGR